MRQTLTWVERPSLDVPELPVWMRFSDNILSGTHDGVVQEYHLTLTGVDRTGASATVPLRVEVYTTWMAIALDWVSFIGGIYGALQVVAPVFLSYHLIFNVVCYGLVFQVSSPLVDRQLTGRPPITSSPTRRPPRKPVRYEYRLAHPTTVEVRAFVRRPLRALPLPRAIAGALVKFVSRFAYESNNIA